MAETVFGNFSDHPGYRAVTKFASLKAALLMRRRSRIVQMMNDRIRMNFRRLADAEYLAGTQWSPQQIQKLDGGMLRYQPVYLPLMEACSDDIRAISGIDTL